MSYKNLIFPGAVNAAGPVETVTLTVTATGATSSNPVKAFASLAEYNDTNASDDDKARHERFSNIVRYFQQYGQPVSIASNGNNVITLTFDRKGLFTDSALGKAPYFNDAYERGDASDLATAYVSDNDHTVTVLTAIVS